MKFGHAPFYLLKGLYLFRACKKRAMTCLYKL